MNVPDTELEIFQIFYTAECLKKIVMESNRYAKEVMNPEQFNSWKPIDVADQGIPWIMGLTKLPSVDYWKHMRGLTIKYGWLISIISPG